MNFIVLDFETATHPSQRRDPCEIGLTFVYDNRIAESKSWLIKPPCYPHFDPNNVAINGITPAIVANSPEFPGIWRIVRLMIEGQFVLAHYTEFDMPVLCNTIKHYGLAFPSLRYACTLQIARKVFPDYSNHKLEHLCQVHHIQYRSHRAGDDSRATAMLALIMFEKSGIIVHEDIPRKLGVNLWDIKGNGECKKLPLPIIIRSYKHKESKWNDSDIDEQRHITEISNRKLGREAEVPKKAVTPQKEQKQKAEKPNPKTTAQKKKSVPKQEKERQRLAALELQRQEEQRRQRALLEAQQKAQALARQEEQRRKEAERQRREKIRREEEERERLEKEKEKQRQYEEQWQEEVKMVYRGIAVYAALILFAIVSLMFGLWKTILTLLALCVVLFVVMFCVVFYKQNAVRIKEFVYNNLPYILISIVTALVIAVLVWLASVVF